MISAVACGLALYISFLVALRFSIFVYLSIWTHMLGMSLVCLYALIAYKLLQCDSHMRLFHYAQCSFYYLPCWLVWLNFKELFDVPTIHSNSL